jgi:DNA polymerase-1
LTNDQLAYAAMDVAVLVPLLEALTTEVKAAGLVEVATIEERCLPAVVWMGQHGIALDRDAWHALARSADEEAERLQLELNRAAPPRPSEMFDAWNWDSTQRQQALAMAGCRVDNTADETLAALDHPLAQLLRRYRPRPETRQHLRSRLAGTRRRRRPRLRVGDKSARRRADELQ